MPKLTLTTKAEEKLQRLRSKVDPLDIKQLTTKFGLDLLSTMALLRPVYLKHPRYLAEDMVSVGARKRFAFSNKRWYANDPESGYWSADDAGEIRAFAAEAWSLVGAPGTAMQTKNLIYFLESSLYVSPLMFDAASHLLGVGNGVVDLTTGELLEPKPEMYLTKFTSVEYHPDADAPTFLKHLARLFEGKNADSVDWLQRAIGSALTHGEQFYVHMVGDEGSGKGTFYRALQGALGNEDQAKSNVVVIGAENLDGRVQHSTWMMDLKGARLAIVEEIGAVSPALMNQLTGGDMITARRMRQDPVTFTPTHTLVCSSNERLQLKGRAGAKGLKRRYKALETGPTVPAEERNPSWEFLVRAEAEGVLAWVIAGHLAWRERGLGDLDGMAEAAESDVTNADWREQWWEQQCQKASKDKANRVSNEAIRTNARHWREKAGYGTQWSDELANEVVAYVKTKGAEPWRTNKERGYYLTLKPLTLADVVKAI